MGCPMGDAPWGVGRRDAGCPPPLCLLLLYGSADYGSPAARLVESLDPPSLVPHAQHRAHGEQRAARRAQRAPIHEWRRRALRLRRRLQRLRRRLRRPLLRLWLRLRLRLLLLRLRRLRLLLLLRVRRLLLRRRLVPSEQRDTPVRSRHEQLLGLLLLRLGRVRRVGVRAEGQAQAYGKGQGQGSDQG